MIQLIPTTTPEGPDPDLKVATQKGLQDRSGGKFESSIPMGLSGRIQYSTIITLNILLSKIRKHPTTVVLKPLSGHNFEAPDP